MPSKKMVFLDTHSNLNNVCGSMPITKINYSIIVTQDIAVVKFKTTKYTDVKGIYKGSTNENRISGKNVMTSAVF